MRAAISMEDRLMEGAARYHWYANQYGWTPEQVDALPVWLSDRLPAVAEIGNEIENERLEAARRG